MKTSILKHKFQTLAFAFNPKTFLMRMRATVKSQRLSYLVVRTASTFLYAASMAFTLKEPYSVGSVLTMGSVLTFAAAFSLHLFAQRRLHNFGAFMRTYQDLAYPGLHEQAKATKVNETDYKFS